MSIQYDMCYRT